LYEQRKCVACHHQKLPVLAISMARSRGVAVPPDSLSHPIRSIVDVWNGWREDLMVGHEVAGGANELTYGLFAFAEAAHPSDQARRGGRESPVCAAQRWELDIPRHPATSGR
jgi:hypothetical protein